MQIMYHIMQKTRHYHSPFERNESLEGKAKVKVSPITTPEILSSKLAKFSKITSKIFTLNEH